jgi:hypothetical protein
MSLPFTAFLAVLPPVKASDRRTLCVYFSLGLYDVHAPTPSVPVAVGARVGCWRRSKKALRFDCGCWSVECISARVAVADALWRTLSSYAGAILRTDIGCHADRCHWCADLRLAHAGFISLLAVIFLHFDSRALGIHHHRLLAEQSRTFRGNVCAAIHSRRPCRTHPPRAPVDSL